MREHGTRSKYVDGCHCPACTDANRVACKEYRQRNKERVDAKQREWQAANADKVKGYKNKWRAANPEKIRAYNQKYWAKRKEASADER